MRDTKNSPWENVRNTCLWFTFFPCFTPFYPLFQPIPMDYISLYPLFINLDVPLIVCPMHPLSNSLLSLCDRHITILIYTPSPRGGWYLFTSQTPSLIPNLPTGRSPNLSNP